MTRTLLIATVLSVFAGPALATGYVAPPPPAPPVVPVMEEDWTGFYIGGLVETIVDGEISDGALSAELDGTGFGLFAGYRYDLGDFVVGGEIDYVIGEADFVEPSIGDTSVDTELLRAGAEAGYDLGSALIYGTVGFARLTVTDQGGGDELSSDGFFFGAGVDYAVTDNVVVGAEILQHRFEDFDQDPTLELDSLNINLGVAFTF